jgi:hypothetical protein
MFGPAFPLGPMTVTDLATTPATGWRAVRPLALVVPVAALLVTLLHLLLPPGPDVAWLTTVSERMLAGQQLYADILESNPPLAALFYMGPVLLGRLLGIAPEPLIVFQTVGFALLGTWFAARLVRRHALLGTPELFAPLAFLFLGAGWGMDFAQREHYALVALLPVAVAIGVRLKGGRLGPGEVIALALFGALCAATKPYFVVALIVPALYAAVRRRKLWPLFAPELLLSAALFLAYWGWIALSFPAYFSEVLPGLAAAYIPDRRPLALLFLNLPAIGFVAFGLAAVTLFRRDLLARPLLGALAMAGLGFFIAYMMQAKGYYYQSMPAFALMALAVLFAFAERNGGLANPVDRILPIGLAALFAFLPMPLEVRVFAERQGVVDAVAPYGANLAIANLTSDLGATNPLVRIVDGQFINSMPALLTTLSAWRIAHRKQVDPATAAEAQAAAHTERARLRDDFVRQPPDIVVTSRDGFDWPAWASEDPAFATILAGYDEIGPVRFGDYDLLLLKRRGLEPVAN